MCIRDRVYSEGTNPNWQMPVEECGNMLVMVASTCVVAVSYTHLLARSEIASTCWCISR